jgi:hypothetical protein
MVTVPEDVTRYLYAVTDRVRDIRQARCGAYTTGSLALGDYRSGRSDIDLMAVVAKSEDFDLRRRLTCQLDHQALSCPAGCLELVLYPLTTVSRPTLDAGYLLNFNTGSALPPVTSFDPEGAPALWYRSTARARVKGAAVGPHQTELLAGQPVGHGRAAATLPTNRHPPVKFVKINAPGQHQRARCDEFLASPGGASEPGTGDRPGALRADVVAPLCHVAEVFNEGLGFGLFGGEQRFAVELGAEDLIFMAHRGLPR